MLKAPQEGEELLVTHLEEWLKSLLIRLMVSSSSSGRSSIQVMAILDHYHRNVRYGAAHDGPHEPVHGPCVHGGALALAVEPDFSRGKLHGEGTRVWIPARHA